MNAFGELNYAVRKAVLHTAYGLLGDGLGGEWDLNAEYTRGVVEMVGDLLGMSPDADREVILDAIWEAPQPSRHSRRPR